MVYLLKRLRTPVCEACGSESSTRRRPIPQALEKEAPELYSGFNAMIQTYYKPGALNRKQNDRYCVSVTETMFLIEDCLIDNFLNLINLYDAPFERNSIAIILRYCLRSILL